jgi:hypothetical protein
MLLNLRRVATALELSLRADIETIIFNMIQTLPILRSGAWSPCLSFFVILFVYAIFKGVTHSIYLLVIQGNVFVLKKRKKERRKKEREREREED